MRAEIIHSKREIEFLFTTLKNSPFPLVLSIKLHIRALDLILCLFSCHRCEKSERESRHSQHFDQATSPHPRERQRHVRGSARIYDVRMAQFVLKIEKLSHIYHGCARIPRFAVSVPDYGSWQNRTLSEEARLVVFFASPRHFDFLNCEIA